MSSSQHASVSMATSSKPALFQVQRTESEGWVGGGGGGTSVGAECGDEEDNEEEDGEKEEE